MPKLFILPAALAIALLAAAWAPASAQGRPAVLGGTSAAGPRAADLVAWTARAEPARRGGMARIVLSAQIAPGWKLYGLDSEAGVPLRVELDPLPSGLRAEAPQQPLPARAYDAALRLPYSYFERSARFEQPLRVARLAARGPRVVRGHVRFTVCDEHVCLVPARVPFAVTLAVS